MCMIFDKNKLLTQKISEDFASIKKNASNKYNLIAISAIPVGIILAIILLICLNYEETDDNSSECPICDTTFTDSENKKTIAKTGMCNNCYGNYKNLEWVLDEDNK